METTDRDKLYRKYWYASGTNLTMTEQLIDITKKATIWAKLNKNDIVLDIGCNDGSIEPLILQKEGKNITLDHFDKKLKENFYLFF